MARAPTTRLGAAAARSCRRSMSPSTSWDDRGAATGDRCPRQSPAAAAPTSARSRATSGALTASAPRISARFDARAVGEFDVGRRRDARRLSSAQPAPTATTSCRRRCIVAIDPSTSRDCLRRQGNGRNGRNVRWRASRAPRRDRAPRRPGASTQDSRAFSSASTRIRSKS